MRYIETIDLGKILGLMVVTALVVSGTFDWKMLVLFVLTTLSAPLKIRG